MQAHAGRNHQRRMLRQSVALCVLLTLVFTASLSSIQLAWQPNMHFGVCLNQGGVWVRYKPVGTVFYGYDMSYGFSTPRIAPRLWPDSEIGWLFLPGWVMASTAVCAAIGVRWIYRRRLFPVGACKSCGYPMDTITSAICPECGFARQVKAPEGETEL